MINFGCPKIVLYFIFAFHRFEVPQNLLWIQIINKITYDNINLFDFILYDIIAYIYHDMFIETIDKQCNDRILTHMLSRRIHIDFRFTVHIIWYK